MKDKNYYMNILGIKNLTKNEVKRAYKSSVKSYHPDNIETGDRNKFLLIKEAYDYLKNLCYQKVVIKVNVTDVITGTSVKYEDLLININPDTLKKFVFNKPRIKGNEIQVKVVNNCGFRLIKKKNSIIITKNEKLTFDDYDRGYFVLTVNGKEFLFETPTSGYLSSIRKIGDGVYIRLNYRIVINN
jgi:curved DNA-binding protein CbpA